MADATLKTLTSEDRTLVRLTVAIQLGRWELVRELRRSVAPDAPATIWRRWREAVLQMHLFAGIPRVVEAFDVLDEEGGLGRLDDDEDCPTPDRFDVGHKLFGSIYAARAEAVRQRLVELHPTLARWIEGHAYGRVLTRAGLDVARREVLAVAALIALDQERQLSAHVLGALRVGVGANVFVQLLDTLTDLIDADVLARASAVVDRYTGED